MAASFSSIDMVTDIVYEANDIPNQFQEIYAIAQQHLAVNRKILLVLDIDGVQDDARLEVEKVIARYLEESEAFKTYIKEKVVPHVIALCTELISPYVSLNADRFKSWIEYLLLPEINQEDLKRIFGDLEQSPEAKEHDDYLNYCELLKLLRRTAPPSSYETVIAEIPKKIISNTALICAMHLSTAICATGDLIVADKNKSATADLATLYRKFQYNGENDSALIQLTARTEAMAYVFNTSLRTMLNNHNTAQLKSLEDQALQYNYNQEKFPLYPTSVIAKSNIIAASRNPKDQVIREFLEQNSLLSNNTHIIFVDDSDSAHKDMARLPTLPGVQCTLQQIKFKRNRSDAEKQAMCVATAENLAKKGLTNAIEEYKKISKEVGDSAASAVIENYVLKLLEKGIIDHDTIVLALNPSHALQQNIPSARVWSDANPNTYYQQPPLNNQQPPTAVPTLQLN